MREQLTFKTTLCGSFQFKKDIDLVREEFEDNGVQVLGPDKGSVIIPQKGGLYIPHRQFNPLSSEVERGLKAIEDAHLANIGISDFVYLIAPHGYIGTTVSLEVGFARAKHKRLYSSRAINPHLDSEEAFQEVIKEIPVKTVSEVVLFERTRRQEAL